MRQNCWHKYGYFICYRDLSMTTRYSDELRDKTTPRPFPGAGDWWWVVDEAIGTKYSHHKAVCSNPQKENTVFRML